MYNVLSVQKPEEYFAGLEQRPAKTVYFTRLIGYNDEREFARFLQRYRSLAGRTGCSVKGPVPNPGEEQVSAFYRTADSAYHYRTADVTADIRRFFPGIDAGRAEELAGAVVEAVESLRQSGKGDNVLKNAYIKFLCWLRYVFDRAAYGTEGSPPKVLYEGDITRYEVLLLRILARAGCDVVYLNYLSDESYLAADRESRLSGKLEGRIHAVPDVLFTEVDLEAEERRAAFRRELDGMENAVNTNRWLFGDVLAAVTKQNCLRDPSSENTINNLFVRYVGIDQRETYLNRLFRLEEDLKAEKKPWLRIDQKIANPSVAEAGAVSRKAFANREELIYGLAEQVSLTPDKVRNQLAKRAFILVMEAQEQQNLTRLQNFGVNLLCWIERYLKPLYSVYDAERLPVLIYYGAPSAREGTFLAMTALMGADVLVICPDKTAEDVFLSVPYGERAQLEELPDSMPIEPYPEREIKVKVSTAAYNAERELDEMLYTGTGLFRNRQFLRSKPVTLKTTYDEIEILWHAEAKYRPGFAAERGRVTVPNLFAKICGVKDGDAARYFNGIRGLLTSNTILVTRIPFLDGSRPNPIDPFSVQFVREGQLQVDMIKNHRAYQYEYLSDDTQDYILEKIQELLDLKWIVSREPHLDETVTATLLNLNRYILKLIQNFDFTREIPKMVVVDTTEAMFSLADCILISFLNLVGFDIAVFTPTGYRNLEKYIRPEAYEQYTVGEYCYHLAVPQLRIPSESEVKREKGLFQKIFGKGRK